MPGAPRQPPSELLAAYTLEGRVDVEYFYLDESNESHGTSYAYSQHDMREEMAHARQTYEAVRSIPVTAPLPALGSSSFAKNAWFVRALEAMAIVGLRIINFGSIDPYAECLCLAAGAAHVTTVDYNRISFDHPSITTMTVDELDDAPSKTLQFD
ncbi:MAG: hypothetical protein SGPRY_006431, partial [Prymnesium sp.]